MKKVLIATDKPFAAPAVNGIKDVFQKAGYECILFENYTEQSQFVEAAAVADAIIIRSDLVTPEVIANAPNLKIVVRAGAGYDNVDLKAATEKGVVVMNTPGQNSNAVAELVFGMMVYSARGFFNGKSGTELKGKKLGIHAYGAVGRCVAAIAKGFNMDVYAYDPFVSKDKVIADGLKFLGKVEDLYSTCDYISLHIPANAETKKSIGARLMSLMPKGGVLVNTARKEVINEEELLNLFAERTDLKYLSDIAPDAAEEFMTKFPNRCFFTPKKMGAQTSEANINAGIAAANQIVDFFEKGDTTFQVNKKTQL